MKIDRPIQTGSLSDVVTSTGNASSRMSNQATPLPPNNTDTTTANNNEQVNLSQSGNHIRQLQTVLAETDVASAERISAIKQAISEGRFQIKPEAIANSLIASVKALLQEKK
ncbi:MAG: flagellar biosynthesis anti-sigma factor FlgM [Proteobacteria bacterium]|nr:flagellar biosynthesis anti-sigma factor FlgM [Pseudomonadota bacterium]MDE3208739.1 flagellar biosynthesis anti-sigma factor FlgM [Pseudomonadota bacterium]